MIESIVDFWWYYIINLKKHERKLLKYQGFGDKTVLEFKRKNNLDWKLVKVLLDNLMIIDGLQLRNYIRNYIKKHEQLFNDDNSFITHFGPAGKSGSIILNQFRHSAPDLSDKIISHDKLNQLPQDANIIFLDDFIGTGTQATDYITSLVYRLNNSIKPYLFTVCSTYSGIFRIQQARSKFTVFSSLILNEQDYFLLDDTCSKFDLKQKEGVEKINSNLRQLGDSFFNQNIPFAFYYSIPDNALPLLWKDKFKYNDDNGVEQEWYGLIPRDY